MLHSSDREDFRTDAKRVQLERTSYFTNTISKIILSLTKHSYNYNSVRFTSMTAGGKQREKRVPREERETCAST